jgi:transposase
VCVQSLKVHLAREADDYTRDETDHKDAVLIGKLISRLDCCLPRARSLRMYADPSVMISTS